MIFCLYIISGTLVPKSKCNFNCKFFAILILSCIIYWWEYYNRLSSIVLSNYLTMLLKSPTLVDLLVFYMCSLIQIHLSIEESLFYRKTGHSYIRFDYSGIGLSKKSSFDLQCWIDDASDVMAALAIGPQVKNCFVMYSYVTRYLFCPI